MGEFLTNAQGEDVVAGVRTPMPIAEMAEKFPEAFKQFQQVCQTLENQQEEPKWQTLLVRAAKAPPA